MQTATAKPQPRYMVVWAVLGVLMLSKIFIAFLGLPKVPTIAILSVLAAWKATLVAMYYMHLKFEPKRLILIALVPLPLAAIFVLAVLTEPW